MPDELIKQLRMSQDPNDRATCLILERLDGLAGDTAMIKRAVFGEEQTDNSGLIKRVKRLEGHDDDLQKLRTQGQAVAAVYGTGLIGGAILLWDKITGLFKH